MNKDQIEDIYALSPMQEGMLFHLLAQPDSEAYFEQVSCDFTGEIDLPAFKQAWQEIVNRYPVFRTSFHWDGLDKPVQVVHKATTLPWEMLDWSTLDQTKIDEKFELLLRDDRRKGFNYEEAPLMRCVLVSTRSNSWKFIWSHHHILMDGWCSGIILDELFKRYEAKLTHKSVHYPVTAPFKNYIAWLGEQEHKKAKAFWSTQLAGFDTPTPLGIGDAILADKSHTNHGYAEYTYDLSPELSGKIFEWTKRVGITLNVLVQGVWAILLSNYSSEDEVVFGATVSGRPPALQNVESIVGLFINSLPVRVNVSQETDMITWLKELQNNNNERTEFSFTSLVDIKKASGVIGDTPLFRSLLVFENYPFDATSQQGFHGLEIQNVKSFEETNYPLTLMIIPRGPVLRFQLNYFKDTFGLKEIERLFTHLQTIIHSILNNPSQYPAKVSILSEAEKKEILVHFNDTKTAQPAGQTVLDLINEYIIKTPDSIAIISGKETISYSQLEQRANRMCDTLVAKGVTKGDVVAVLQERSTDLIVSVLGIIKAGAAFLPIDTSLPVQRIHSLIGDACVKILLSDKRNLLEEIDVKTLVIDPCIIRHTTTILYEKSKNDAPNANDAAYIIYTSGSTGKPKGVKINHSSLLNYVVWANNYYFVQNTEGGDFPLFTSPAFDLTLSSIFIPLSKGKTIKIYTETEVGLVMEDIFGPDGTLDTVKLTPSHITLLKDIPGGNSKLRTLIVGGEALKEEHIQIINDKWPAVTIFNEYGPTEATIGCTAIAVAPNQINAGKPIANSLIYILNKLLEPVPIGIKGEIYIGGDCLATGYIGQPEQTALRFINSPFKEGEKVYRTGDIGCWLEDGNVQYFGRADDQVKVRGYRIEPGEIESQINKYLGVIDAIVLPVKNSLQETSLVAFIKVELPDLFNPEDLNGALQKYLPAYMLPGQYQIVDDFPLTPNGKTNKKALLAVLKAVATKAKPHNAPINLVQEIVASIWTEILKIQSPGISDNFFDLGGHSLNATQMTSRLRSAFKVNIGVKEVLENPTISQLSLLIEKLKGSNTYNDFPPIVRVSGKERSQLSFAQQRLWFLDRLEGKSASYNIPEAIKIEGHLNKTALQKAFTEIISRHEILRTNFHDLDGKAYQLIKEPQTFVIPIIETSDDEVILEKLIADEAAKLFDLEHDSLIRAILFMISDQEYMLSVNMHHIISDGWSAGIFIGELISLYQTFTLDAPSRLPSLPVQYADFAYWQRELKNKHLFEPQLAYWKNKLSGAPFIIDLPTDKPRPTVRTEKGNAYRFTLPTELSTKLKNLSSKQGATLFMTLLSAYSLLLSRYSRQSTLLIGSSIANRNRKETETLIGFFINIVVYRVNLALADNFTALIEQVKQLAFEAYAHQDIPFDQVIDEIQPERDMSYSPIFQVAFDMQNMPVPAFEIPGLKIIPKDITRPSAKYDLYLSMEDTPTGLKAIMEYNNDLFLHSTIMQMALHLSNLLEGMAENPKQRIKTLPLLNKNEYAKIVYDWNNTDSPLPADKTILNRIAEIATKKPEHIAFEYDGSSLTYNQLENEANNFARYLRSKGLKEGNRVGVIAIRSIRILSAIIGIMKAGGVYVPIDPEYPFERISFMLRDADVQFLAGEENILKEIDLPFINNQEAVAYTGGEAIDKLYINPSSLAYIIYTSGSTGNPKGVMLRHSGLLNLSIELGKGFLVEEQSKTLQFASLSFDASIAEIFVCLYAASTVVMAPKAKMLPGPDLISLLEDSKISYVIIPPSILKALTYTPLPLLKTLIVAGEACQPELVNLWGEGRNFINAYGPTEYTVCASLTLCNIDKGPLHIGRPIGNTAIYILDENLLPLPPGIPGELFISGAGLAEGYINLPEINAERFIADPFSKKPGAKMYRSGDMAKFLPDGNIYYIGRADRQVKLRGFRIEPGEIEAVLKKYPAVIQAVIQVLQDTNGHQRLVAFVTLENVLSKDEIKLEAFLQDKLPAYLQPNSIIVLDEIPLTLNGKVDQKALELYSKGNTRTLNEYVPPRNAPEKKLAAIWQEVLGIENVGVHHNFFKLGGDSILSIQIVSRARSVGLEFTPKDVFENQTIALLAAAAKEKGKTIVEQGKITGKVPLSPIQQWFFEQQFKFPDHFNQAVLLETTVGKEPEIIEQLIQKLVVHHDILRSRFYKETDDWVQEIMPGISGYVFNSYDLSDYDDDERESKFLEIANDTQSGLKLENGDVFKAAFFRMSNNMPSRLLLIAHHLIIDGVSWRVLLEDFFNMVNDPLTLDLPEKTYSFKEWVNAISKYTVNEITPEKTGYWKKISELEIPAIPVDYMKNTTTNALTPTGMVVHYLDEANTQNLLKVVPIAYRTHIQEVLLSAFVLSLSQWTGSNTAFIELEGHGREDLVEGMDVSRTVGWFTSAYPAVFHLPENNDPGKILQSIKEQYRNIPDKGISYGLLRHLSAEKECFKMKRSPQVIFNYLGQSDVALSANNGWKLSDIDSGFEQSPGNHRTHLLNVNLIVIEGQLKIGIEYDKDQHSYNTINGLAETFISNLSLLINHCIQPEIAGISIADFPVSTLDEHNLALLSTQLTDEGHSLRDIADVYPLSPLQQGLLFESLLNPDAVSYREQLSVTIKGELNTRLFKKAWQNVINKYDIFRTAFFWDGLDAPVQVVFDKAEMLWSEEVWANNNGENDIKKFLETDIHQPFIFSEASLMRFKLGHLQNDSYFFCWTHHHILMDGWCLPIILREVFDQYEALQFGKELRITHTRPYVNFISWLAKQNADVAKNWWVKYLDGFHHPTSFGIDRHNPAINEKDRMQEYMTQLDSDLEQCLKQFSQNEGVTLNILIHAAWALLLSKYSGTKDVVFGATVSGRPPELEGVEKMVGLFINSVPVRVGLNDDDDELGKWLRDLQFKQIERDNYSYTSLTKVREYSGVEGNQPLFESLIIFENYPIDKSVDEGIQDLTIGSVKFSEQTHYPVTLMVLPGDTLTFRISYDASRFAKETIERLQCHLFSILKGFSAGANQLLGQISLLDQEETNLIINAFNAQGPVVDHIKSVFEDFTRYALAYPDAIALLFEGENYSYGEINLRANQLANYLLDNKLKTGDLVGLCMDRSPEMIICLLAILKAGAAYLPLDPKFPVERLRYMLQDSKAPILLTENKYRSLWQQEQALILTMEEVQRRIIESSTNDPGVKVNLDDLVYVIYTSGSTGKPKGVQITHGALGNFIASMQLEPCINKEDVLLAVTTISFDIAGLEIFLPLTSGAMLALLPDEIAADPLKLISCLKKIKPTIMQATPTTWQMLLNNGWEGSPNLKVLCGGEALPNELARGLVDHTQSVWNMYGPTETTIWSAVLQIDLDKHLSANGYAMIGGPIANTQLYILDQAANPVPVGVAGELYIGGKGVAKGYLELPELTNEKFISDPFVKNTGNRIYRTGDMAKWTPAGTISFLGRMDQQVKIRGFRIETGEIESVMKEIDGISEAVVIAGKDNQHNDCLLAYMITEPGKNISSLTIRNVLQSRLPAYMIPSAFTALDKLPLTPNGKTDRKALKNSYITNILVDDGYVPPVNPVEQKIHAIWSLVLGLPKIGIKDNFFAIGGHSLLATQCISRVRAEFEVEFPLKKLFDHPDIESFAASLQLFINEAKGEQAQIVPDDDNEVFEF